MIDCKTGADGERFSRIRSFLPRATASPIEWNSAKMYSGFRQIVRRRLFAFGFEYLECAIAGALGNAFPCFGILCIQGNGLVKPNVATQVCFQKNRPLHGLVTACYHHSPAIASHYAYRTIAGKFVQDDIARDLLVISSSSC